MNIPIYRAKKIDSDEYVEGFYFNYWNKEKHYIGTITTKEFTNKVNEWTSSIYEIDPTTLAIHFPDMLDSQGNRIFASLSEDGKGGDIMKDDEYYGIAKYSDCEFVVEYENVMDNINNQNFQVIGIKE